MNNLIGTVKWLAVNYKNTNLENLLENIESLQQSEQLDVLSQYAAKYSIDTADGVWLDYVGFRLGVFSRPAVPVDNALYFGFDASSGTGFDQQPFSLGSGESVGIDDATFRAFLKVIAQQLITDVTPDAIRDALLLFFDIVFVRDLQTMSITVTLITSIPFVIVNTVLKAGIIPKPAAVRITGVVTDGDYFGFDVSGGSGFDQNPYVENIDFLA